MKNMKRLLMMAAIAIFGLSAAMGDQGKHNRTWDRPKGRPLMQIALLLDTSNSMDGLISQAKSQLWRMVNELATARRRGMDPVIEVALFEYGNNRLSPEDGYIRRVLPFTRDLDEVSERLFRLSTCGGDEYCGAVIDEALERLDWDGDDATYKAIFIAGNEPFTQGPRSYRKTIQSAAHHGIVVNTVFCGDYHEGVSTNWKDGAEIGRGEYMNIDPDRVIVVTKTPYDEEILILGQRLNTTYIYYGEEGRRYGSRQNAMDKCAESEAAAGAPMERALFKAKAQYSSAAKADAVSMVRERGVPVSSLKKTELPPEMRAMNAKEMEQYIAGKEQERKTIQARIGELEEKRRVHLEQQARGGSKEDTLDRAVISAVRKQAQEKKFEFK